MKKQILEFFRRRNIKFLRFCRCNEWKEFQAMVLWLVELNLSATTIGRLSSKLHLLRFLCKFHCGRYLNVTILCNSSSTHIYHEGQMHYIWKEDQMTAGPIDSDSSAMVRGKLWPASSGNDLRILERMTPGLLTDCVWNDDHYRPSFL